MLNIFISPPTIFLPLQKEAKGSAVYSYVQLSVLSNYIKMRATLIKKKA